MCEIMLELAHLAIAIKDADPRPEPDVKSIEWLEHARAHQQARNCGPLGGAGGLAVCGLGRNYMFPYPKVRLAALADQPI